jgi:hypothetical protein
LPVKAQGHEKPSQYKRPLGSNLYPEPPIKLRAAIHST